MPIKVYVVGNSVPVARMFYERSVMFAGVLRPEDADVLVWTGGPDVDPSWYNEKTLAKTFVDARRDERDIDVWMKAREDQLKIGICRGAQLLNVMNDGSLWQDVDNHRQSHMVTDLATGKSVWVSSTHHQAMRPGPYAVAVATTNLATIKEADGVIWKRYKPGGQMKRDEKGSLIREPESIDYEVLWYPNTSSLCFQPHPEILSFGQCREYFFDLLFKYWMSVLNIREAKGKVA